MGRIPRKLLVGSGTVNHCTWRCHNFSHSLGTSAAKEMFLRLLAIHKREHGIEILSYSVMDTHPHVQLRSLHGQATFSRFWQVVNQRFARWHNKMRASRGQVVMERLSSGQVQADRHQLAIMRYGDLNPVRAGIVKSPKNWPWSSYRHYAFGDRNELITDAPAYLALGKTPAERRKAYVHLFATPLRSAESMLFRRPELVNAPFIGTAEWVQSKARDVEASMKRKACFDPPS